MAVRWLAFVALFLFAASAHSQTRYVSDRTIVELRRGASTEHRILRNLEAGEALQVLEQDEETGYSRVRVLDQGTEGWILTRFLVSEPIARDRLAAAERDRSTAEQRVAALEQQVGALSAELEATKADLEQTRTAHTGVSQEFAALRTAAANVIDIREDNESLRQRLIQRDREVEELTAQNAQLSARSNQNWFIVGASVLFGGIVIGLIVPTLRRRRRSDW